MNSQSRAGPVRNWYLVTSRRWNWSGTNLCLRVLGFSWWCGELVTGVVLEDACNCTRAGDTVGIIR